MSTNNIKAGRSNYLYYNSAFPGASAYATPTWVVVNRIGDVDRTNTKVATEVDMRASQTTITVFSNKNRELSFTYYKRQGSTDTVFNKLLDSYENDTVMDMKISEQASGTSGAVYDRGPFVVAEMTKSEPIAGVDSFDIKLKVADAETIPASGTAYVYQANLTEA